MKKLIIKVIKSYQKYYPFRGHCKYTPSCSNYAITAYQEHHFFYATFLTISRILRCNPFSKGGCDPVPKKK